MLLHINVVSKIGKISFVIQLSYVRYVGDIDISTYDYSFLTVVLRDFGVDPSVWIRSKPVSCVSCISSSMG